MQGDQVTLGLQISCRRRTSLALLRGLLGQVHDGPVIREGPQGGGLVPASPARQYPRPRLATCQEGDVLALGWRTPEVKARFPPFEYSAFSVHQQESPS